MAVSPDCTQELISALGEEELIRRFFTQNTVSGSAETVGIGDDCAVLDYSGDERLLVTADQLVERVHFLKEKSSSRNIGYKSVAVNFSDIAAMGGRPTGLFLSLALPETTPVSWIEGFSDGLHELCRRYQVPLLGGDTTGSKQDIVINLTVLGKALSGEIKLRSGAGAGDALCVTGTLGDSAAGLQLLSSPGEAGLSDESRSYLIGRHERPQPALDEGSWLSKRREVHAMIDLSDGLATDAGHIANRSRVGMDIELDRIPVSDALGNYAKLFNRDFLELALFGGEDYRLLCAVDAQSYDDLSRSFEQEFQTPLYRVGRVTGRHQQVRYSQNGKPVPLTGRGFDHFKLKR